METKPYIENSKVIKVPRFEERAGFYTTPQRSQNMAKIRSKNSIPELKLRRALWAQRIRFRLHPKTFPGKPDLIIRKYKLAIFVDGDFWHGYDWEKRKENLKKNTKFWIPKIERNMQRDRFVNASLSLMGYNVMRFWEHEINKNLAACVNQILLYIEAAKMGGVPDSGL